MTSFGYGTPVITAHIHRHQLPPFNLQPYIKSVSLNKDLSEPAGMFEMNLAYAPDRKYGSNGSYWESPELIFRDIYPGDYIEIQIQNQPGSLSYWMRGFFDNVSISEQAANDGSISRQITLNGRDYGSLMQNYQVVYNTTGQDLAKLGTADGLALMLGDKNGIPPKIGAPGIVEQVVNRILNDGHIKGLQQYNSRIKLVKPNVSVPRYFGSLTSILQTYTGTLDDLVRQIQSPPWAEYFIRDEEDGPHFYYRMTPFLDYKGFYAWTDSTVGQGVKFFEIDTGDVIENDLTKSQNEVYTYFVSTPTALQDLGQQVLAYGLKNDNGKGNPYWDGASAAGKQIRARRFGYRPLEVQSPWVLGDISKKNFKPIDEQTSQWYSLLRKMNLWLVNTMGFMEEMRSGTIICRGNIGCRVGDYVYYRRPAESTGSYYYVQGIDISWQEGSPIQTMLQVIRGWPLAKMDTHTRPHAASKPQVRHPQSSTSRRTR